MNSQSSVPSSAWADQNTLPQIGKSRPFPGLLPAEPGEERLQMALASLRRGRGVLVTDDENRENEADLIYAAEFLTESQMALLIRECSGIVCLCLPEEKVRELGLAPMVAHNTSIMKRG